MGLRIRGPPRPGVVEGRGGETLALGRTLWFLQSKEVPEEQFDDAEKALSGFAQTLNGGRRTGLLVGGVKNVRLLARSKQDVLRLKAEIEDLAEIDVDWDEPVECKKCYIQFVLFPVRSGDLKPQGGKRYYGLARAAFQEEMQADVAAEMGRIRWWAVGYALLVAKFTIKDQALLGKPFRFRKISALPTYHTQGLQGSGHAFLVVYLTGQGYALFQISLGLVECSLHPGDFPQAIERRHLCGLVVSFLGQSQSFLKMFYGDGIVAQLVIHAS